MSWPNKETIAPGVTDMLRVNMSLKAGEKLLIISDLPHVHDWQTVDRRDLADMLERAMLGRSIADIAREYIADLDVRFLPFPATGGHGTEPDEATAAQMQEADVLICLTHYSMSHTNARENATQAGVRIASMPALPTRCLLPGGRWLLITNRSPTIVRNLPTYSPQPTR